ncbi:MAG: aldo/keto reductase [Alphaproteobacteria bacterium]|nr:aldo/keto reductase [Alphaproteobacteria bacterium]
MAQGKAFSGPSMNRAQFLRLAAGAAAASAIGPGAAGAATAGKMATRPIPKTGEALPVVGLGTYKTFDVGLDDEERRRLTEVLERLFAAGGTVIDSSPMYGRSESVVGNLLSEMGAVDRAFVATKVWTKGRESGIAQMSTSERRLRDQRIELMQVHNLVDTATHLKTLKTWKEQGRIQYIGITHYTPRAFDDLEAVMAREPIDFLQIPYSIALREAESRILPRAAELGVATLINIPYAKGSLFRAVKGRELPGWAADLDCRSWGQFFLKYLLGHPAVTCVIPGTSKPRHMIDNAQAGMGRLPDAAARRRMAEFWDTV